MQGAVLHGVHDIRFDDRAEPALVESTRVRTAARDIRRPASTGTTSSARKRRVCACHSPTARWYQLARCPQMV